MRYKEPYSYYKRKTKSGKTVFYYRTYDEEDRRTSGISTGCTTFASFRHYMAELIRKGELIPKKDMRFADFTENFWIFDKCKYVQMKNNRKENSISKEHCNTERGYLKNHI